tara:strand:+ start:907 stop:1032 length:126 start_codon:yes stop_codon:yes gene_type:complete
MPYTLHLTIFSLDGISNKTFLYFEEGDIRSSVQVAHWHAAG